MRCATRCWLRALTVLLPMMLFLSGLPALQGLPALRLFAPVPAAASGPLSVPVTLKISVSTAGGEANNHSYAPSVSADGQWVAFESRASNLLPAGQDTNLKRDIFVRNTRDGTTQRVSVSSSEVQADQDSFQPSISRDGRYVAFVSQATNLVAGGPADQKRQVFVRDVSAGTTEVVSVSTSGSWANNESGGPRISPDGRYVAYQSLANNLAPPWSGDNVFVRDRFLQTTTHVSQTAAGQAGGGGAASISRDGRLIAFGASNAVYGPPANGGDVFVKDGTSGALTRISVANDGGVPNYWSGWPAISWSGRHVGFVSAASNIVSGDPGTGRDVFRRDIVTGTSQWVSVNSLGQAGNGESPARPSISARGRYVAFLSLASNLAAGDSNGVMDAFVRDIDRGVTETLSLTSGQAYSGAGHFESNSDYHDDISISGDGRWVAFSSFADGLAGPNDFGVSDIYLRDRGERVEVEQTLGRGMHYQTTTAFWADPVNTATGSFVHDETDLQLAGAGVPFVFRRFYNSADDTFGELGRGWTHSLATRLEVEWDGDVTLFGEDGVQVRYAKQPDGSLEPLTGTRSALSSISGGYHLVRRDQTRYAFDTSGRLTDLRDRSGQGLSLAYDGNGRLDAATDAAGRVVDFSHDANGMLSSVALPDGRNVSYAYTSSRLSSVTDVRGGVIDYTYNADGLLTDVFDQNDDTVVENVYDADGRVVQQYDPLGNLSTFAWDPLTQTATMTDAAGKVWRDVYDENVLASRTDPDEEQVTVVHDGELNPSQVTDPLGKVWLLEFDSRGNLLSRTAPAPLGYADEWVYDSKNNPTSYTDARGNEWLYEYDAQGRLTKQTRPGGTLETYTYNAAGQVATHTDFRGNTTDYAYNADDNLIEVETPLGYSTSYTYDAVGRMTASVEARGNEAGADPNDFKTTYSYNAANHLTSTTDPLGHTTSYTYDAAGRVATKTDPAGRTTSYAYNDAGELISETAPGTRTTNYEYDTRGKLIAVTQLGNRKTTYTYDDAGRLASKVTPRGNVAGADPDDYRWSYTYDAAGRLTQTLNPLGATITQAYDAIGRLIARTDERGKTTTFDYDANSNQTTVTDPLSNTTTTGYDALNRATTVTDPRGKTTTTSFDANGNRISVTSPLGNVTSYAYDADNRLTSMVEPRGNIAGAIPADYQTSYTYDAAGHQLSVTDPLGGQTRNEYDEAGRMVRVIDPLNYATTTSYDTLDRISAVTTADSAVTSYSYDTAGDLTSRTDANGHVTNYTYDAAGRRISSTSPLTQVWNYTYDAADNLTQIIDAAGNRTPDPTDGITGFSYDPLDRQTSIIYSDPATPDVTQTYDAAGNRLTMSDGAGIESRAYDDAGRLTQIVRGASILGYEYDAAGNITKRIYPDGTQVAATFDDDARLASITQGSATTSYIYDAAAHPISVSHANGTLETRIWDRVGRPSEIRHKRATTTFALANYVRDAAGNPATLTTLEGTVTYSYDNRHRLTQACYTASCSGITADGGDTYIRYTYDGVGNRLTQTKPLGTTTYTYNAADQLTQEQTPTGTNLYAYDANGNQTRSTAGLNSYDQAGRLTQSQNGGTTVTYSYAGDSKRIQAIKAGLSPQTTKYTWDPNNPYAQLILEQDGTGALIRRHTHGLDELTITSPDPLNPATTRTTTLHGDALRSTLAVTDTSGDTDWRYRYQPYGETRTETRDDLFAAENRIRYTGQLLDLETSNYHLRARQYDPRTGRLLTPDPLDRHTGEPYINGYAYADNQPTVLADPSGMRGQRDIIALTPIGNNQRDVSSPVPPSKPTRAFDRFIHQLRIFASVAPDNDWFVRNTARRLAGFDAGRIGVLPPNRTGEIPYEILGSDGWRPELIDDDESPARHFIGFFATGYFHPHTALTQLKTNEAPGRRGASMQDIRAGLIAIDIGIALRRGRLSMTAAIDRITDRAGGSHPGGRREPEPVTHVPGFCYLPGAPC